MVKKKYTIRITKGAKKHDGINMRTTSAPEEVTKGEFLRRKRLQLRDKKNIYSIEILEGEKEPLLIREKLQRLFQNLKRMIFYKKPLRK